MKTTPATEVSDVPNKKRLTEEFAPNAMSNRQAVQSPEHMGLKTVSVANEVPGYTQLQQQIHDGLRAQHPEWVQPNGDSPICNCYESRFAELLRIFARDSVNKKCVKIGNICGAISPRPLDYQGAKRERVTKSISPAGKFPGHEGVNRMRRGEKYDDDHSFSTAYLFVWRIRRF